ncbi:hypothetical protein SISNIDRAFT_495340 [Sistotremastrum niveocremeum HHB9708]|uniref:Uncharacterized protein n=1 Tax=Sistotremastrum niveocremeum HHB9708 TaxID=1314777 RepID=A0A164V305_9AGAM|nr:hypothetical protein SISNIDRAFT_495340 [Sistotremastrum niveocremeum HHB9708]
MENESRGPTIVHGPATALLKVLGAYKEIIDGSVALKSEYESLTKDLEAWSTKTTAAAQVFTSTLSEIETNFNVLLEDASSCADARIILQNMISFLSSSAATSENLRARITTFGERIKADFSCDSRTADENVVLSDMPALLNNLVQDVTRQAFFDLIQQLLSGRFDTAAFSMRSIWNCLDVALIEIEGLSDAERYETSLSLISIPDGVNEDFHTINSWLSELQASGGVTQRADFRG